MMNLSRKMQFSQKPEGLSPLILAYIGDAVYELYIRLLLVDTGVPKMKNLHKEAVSLVNADAQSNFLKILEPNLTEEEKRIVRQGRNAKSGQVPKNANVANYRFSTGFEALLGFLYLKGENERILELMEEIKPVMNGEEGENLDEGKVN